MKLRLVKIGNSYVVRIPIETARPFIGGNIDIRFPEYIPAQQKNKKEVNKSPHEETKWERIAKRYE